MLPISTSTLILGSEVLSASGNTLFINGIPLFTGDSNAFHPYLNGTELTNDWNISGQGGIQVYASGNNLIFYSVGGVAGGAISINGGLAISGITNFIQSGNISLIQNGNDVYIGSPSGSISDSISYIDYNPDNPPTGNIHPQNDEFTGVALNPNLWTVFNNTNILSSGLQNSTLSLACSTHVSDSLNCLFQNIPTGNYWTMTSKINMLAITNNYPMGGLIVRDSSSSKLVGFLIQLNANGTYGWHLQACKYNNGLSFNSLTSESTSNSVSNSIYLQLMLSGNNFYYNYSMDGVNFLNFYSESTGVFLSSVPVSGGYFNNPCNYKATLNSDWFRWNWQPQDSITPRYFNNIILTNAGSDFSLNGVTGSGILIGVNGINVITTGNVITIDYTGNGGTLSFSGSGNLISVNGTLMPSGIIDFQGMGGAQLIPSGNTIWVSGGAGGGSSVVYRSYGWYSDQVYSGNTIGAVYRIEKDQNISGFFANVKYNAEKNIFMDVKVSQIITGDWVSLFSGVTGQGLPVIPIGQRLSTSGIFVRSTITGEYYLRFDCYSNSSGNGLTAQLACYY